MRLTREKHLSYMVKLAPLLLLAVVLQSYLYSQFFPQDLARDIGIFLSVGVALILLGFLSYDHFHQVLLAENTIEVSIHPLRYQESILYRSIVAYEVISNRYGFSQVKLELKNGEKIVLRHLDDGEKLIQWIVQKQQGQSPLL